MPPNFTFLKPISQKLASKIFPKIQFKASISTLKLVEWRKDKVLDEAIENDKQFQLTHSVVTEVMNEPGQVIPTRYLHKRRKRIGVEIVIDKFLAQIPGLFDTYMGQIRPYNDFEPFLRPSKRLRRYLEDRDLIYLKNEGLIVAKLCKLLMMSKNRVISTDKLFEVKREFGFPDDLLLNLVPRYERYFRLVGNLDGEGDKEGEGEGEEPYLELVSWNYDYAKSVIELRAEEESRKMGIQVRPSFNWEMPAGIFYKKKMREWVRDWMELPYISPYEDGSKLDPRSREAEKRMVGVLHELLSLSLYKRIRVDVLGKFCEDYNYSDKFLRSFGRHSRLFYVSLTGGIRTAVLREAYKGNELIDRDPLLEMDDRFIELIAEGRRQSTGNSKLQNETMYKDMELITTRKSELDIYESDEL